VCSFAESTCCIYILRQQRVLVIYKIVYPLIAKNINVSAKLFKAMR